MPARTSATTERTRAAPGGSSIAVGSSSSSTPGRSASTPARASRCRCPPDRCAVERSSATSSPTASSASRTRPQISAGGTPWFSRPKATSSPHRDSTVCACGSCSSRPVAAWPPDPVTARVRASRAGTPSTSRLPSSSPVPCSLPSSRPASPASRVDFPAPLGPSSSTRSPGSTSRSTSRTAHARRPAWRQPQPRRLIRPGCGVTPVGRPWPRRAVPARRPVRGRG